MVDIILSQEHKLLNTVTLFNVNNGAVFSAKVSLQMHLIKQIQ